MPKLHVETNINGDPVEYLCEPHETMLSVLRETLGMTGTKEVGTGDCGMFNPSRWQVGVFLLDVGRGG